MESHRTFKSVVLILGLFMFIIGQWSWWAQAHIGQIEEEKIETFFEQAQTEKEKTKKVSDDYIAVIEIPKINLKKGLYAKTSSKNQVDKNIEIIKQSDYPDVKKGTMILASHSGVGEATHFNDLPQLKKGDVIYIDYQGKRYTYEVHKKEEIEKTGKLSILKDDITKLLLITCIVSTTKQLVVTAYQK